MNTSVYIHLLGGLGVQEGVSSVLQFQTCKTGLLLAYLAYNLPQVHRRDALVELFWPETDIEAGRHCLRQALSSLRRRLEPLPLPIDAVLQTTRLHIQLNSSYVGTDVAAFEQAANKAGSVLRLEERVALVQSALDLYPGPLLPGFCEDWIVTERERLAAIRLRLLRLASATLTQRGEMDHALEYALRAFTLTPLCQQACYDIMQLYRTIEQPVEALRQFRNLVQRLERYDGSRPTRPLYDLAHQLQQYRRLASASTRVGQRG